jgi:hypothetical protein
MLTTWQASRASQTQTLSKIEAIESQFNETVFVNSAKSKEKLPAATLNTKDSATPEAKIMAQAADWFASNRMVEVESLLTHSISSQGPLCDHVPTWLLLLDFYRAVNKPSLFDVLALNFSIRFGRSTPSWVSIPELAKIANPQTSVVADNLAQVASEYIPVVDWIAPQHLAEASFAGFDTRVHQAAQERRTLHLDWRSATSVDPVVWPLIKSQLSSIASQNLHCVMYGLSAFTRTFEPTLPESMLAQMALLRCQNQAHQFEELAMDYCTYFEVSPPDWIPPVCRLTLEDSPLTAEQLPNQQKRSGLAASTPAVLNQLVGEVDQIPADWAVKNGLKNSEDRLSIQCDKLIRISPQATQQLREQMQKISSQGIRAEFKDLHRLIAAYFLQQGLYEMAKVSIRKD